MEISGLGNPAPASKSTATETTESKVDNSNQAGQADVKSSVSNESQASLVPPPSATSESGNQATAIPTAEGNTGGQINISV